MSASSEEFSHSANFAASYGCFELLKTAVDELGFRYLRFHAIFHDVPGMGHGPPAIEWLEKAIDELDGLPKDREKKMHGPIRRPATTRATTRTSLPVGKVQR